MPSRPREFHPEPLTDSGREPLDSSGSCHRAKAAAFHSSSGSSRCRLTRSHGDDLPPSLHGHYPASSLLRGSPPLSSASLLSASRLAPLVPCMGLFLSRSFGTPPHLLSFISFFVRSESRSFVPTRASPCRRAQELSRLAVAPTSWHAPPLPGHTLTASSTTARLVRSG